MHLTPYQAKYFAHDLTRRAASGLDGLSTLIDEHLFGDANAF